MRILIVSDTHGKLKNLHRVIEMESPVDYVIHLGDSGISQEELADMAACPVAMVAGNTDFFSPLDREEILEFGEYRIFITHGNYYNVDAGIDDLVKEARGRKVDAACFGHTHRPLLEYLDDLVVFNPGSLSMPRQEGRLCSYGILTFDRNGRPQFEHYYLS